MNEYFRPRDLKSFDKEYKIPEQTIENFVGTFKPIAQTEASLDIQYITAIGQDVPTWWVWLDGHATNPFNDWLVWAAKEENIPLVHSLSVGAPEGEIGSDIISRMNMEMMALGARGVSILFASGDSGYVVEQKYGASSPYVTAVGGVYMGEIFKEPLQVDPISTGGFSSMNENPIQDYQKDAVEKYLKTSGKRPLHFNSSRRCVPDISAFDSDFWIITGGSDTPVGGTSAAAPVVAGMISLINNVLLINGHSPLGFLNPFLYQNEDAFLDITKGDNGGFAAVEGYDPASGLGTFSESTFTVLVQRALAAKQEALESRQRHSQQN